MTMRTVRIEVYQQDWMPGFAAFNDDGSIQKGAPVHVAINLGDLLSCVKDQQIKLTDLPYVISESVMHEIIHALESWTGNEFNEDRVQALIAKYSQSKHGGPLAQPSDVKKEFPVKGAIPVRRCQHCGMLIFQPWGGADQPLMTGWRHLRPDGSFAYHCDTGISPRPVAEPKPRKKAKQ